MQKLHVRLCRIVWMLAWHPDFHADLHEYWSDRAPTRSEALGSGRHCGLHPLPVQGLVPVLIQDCVVFDTDGASGVIVGQRRRFNTDKNISVWMIPYP